MTDQTTAVDEAVQASLPQLAAMNSDLAGYLHTLLSPAVVAALGAAPGSVQPPAGLDDPADTAARATALLRDIDSRLPALRVSAETGRGN